MASGTFRTGRHSKYLPAHLAERYQTAVNDADLLALHDEIALTDTRVLALLDTDNLSADDWETVERLLDLRRRLVDTERKRLVDLQQMLTAEQAMTLLAAVVETVKRHVTDRDALAAISADLARLVTQHRGPTPPS